MSNQVDYVNLPLPKGAEQIAEGAAQFATALAGSSVKIAEQYAEKERLRKKAIDDANKEQNRVRANIRTANEKRRRDGQAYLAEKGQDTLDYERESRRLGELANDAELMLTPPYSEGYSSEELAIAQEQVDEFFNYINTSKAAGGKVESAITASKEIENSGGIVDKIDGYTYNVKELIPITDEASYTRNNTYNTIVNSYFTKGKVLPDGWKVDASNKSEKGKSVSTYKFTDTKGPKDADGNPPSFDYTVDGSSDPIEFSTSIGKSALNQGIETLRDDAGNIEKRFQYSSSASLETTGVGLQRIDEYKMVNMSAMQTEFKDQVRGNIQGAFLDGRVGLLNYFAQNANQKNSIERVIEIYDSEEFDDGQKIDQLTNLIFNPMFEEFQSQYNPREATAEDIEIANENGITLLKPEGKDGPSYVYSEIKSTESKQKRKEGGGESTATENAFRAASQSAQTLFDGGIEGGQIEIKGMLFTLGNDGKVMVKRTASSQGFPVNSPVLTTKFSSFLKLKQALPGVFGELNPAERQSLQ